MKNLSSRLYCYSGFVIFIIVLPLDLPRATFERASLTWSNVGIAMEPRLLICALCVVLFQLFEYQKS